MVGTTLTFVKQVANGTDAFNNPTYTTQEVEVDDCLIAPITEPATAREQQAMDQSKDQVRIHLPKATTEDVSNSTVEWDGKVFQVDSSSIVFMNENTPTRWNRYFRAELVNNEAPLASFLLDGFLTEDGESYFVSENSYYYFAQEMVA